MLILVDTNVLLRLLNRTDPEHKAIRTAFRVLKGRGDSLVTGSQNLAEFWNVCTRPATARGGYGLSGVETAKRLAILERIVTVLPDSPMAYTAWKGLVVKYDVKGVQVHDAKLVALMTAYGLTQILTLNAGDFSRYSEVTAFTPAAIAASPAP
jgi:predicted nucleic acid-binding protein